MITANTADHSLYAPAYETNFLLNIVLKMKIINSGRYLFYIHI